jgi:hypothetical protein
MLPFTLAHFLAVVVAHNYALWPAQIAAALLGLVIVSSLCRRGLERAYRALVPAGLALMWLATGIVHHAPQFAPVNAAAWGSLLVIPLLWSLVGGSAALKSSAASNSVELTLLTDKTALERVLEFVVQGNTAQINDPAFVKELKAWIRFSGTDAVRLGDGLYAASSGNPTLPSWLGSLMFDLVFKPKAENDKYAKQLRSSAGVAVFTAKNADKVGWIEVGRSYERFALQAAALGIRNAMLNQPIEVASLRESFASAVGVAGRRPDLVVRFGRGPKLPPSLRRPVAAVMV